MRKYLRHDSETRELRLVYTDLWRGQHEHTEYRVTDCRGGDVVRNRADLDGQSVSGGLPDLYVDRPWPHNVMRVWAEEAPVVPTVKTPCPKAANLRRKCALCAVRP